MKLSIERTLTLEVEDCISCGIEFGLPGRFLDERRKLGTNFYCPNGHAMTFGESETTRLRKQLTQAQDATARAEARARSNWEAKEAEARAHRATKGVLTKTRKRVANGVCPCCKRTFADLQRHMGTRHPDYVETAG